MILAEKIKFQRKKLGMSQEDLAEKCKVSRQSISKWEADIALPEMDKCILLGRIFNVSMDYLMLDYVENDEVKTVHSCSAKCTSKEEKLEEEFKGIIIKESLKDENILDEVKVNKVELWKTSGVPKYWTAVYFSADNIRFPEELSASLKSDLDNEVNWFVDMKKDNIKYIVFHHKILKYEIGNEEEKGKVCDECRNLGIPDEQIQWEE